MNWKVKAGRKQNKENKKEKEMEKQVYTQVDMNIIIHFDIEISIPFWNSSGEENFGFGRQFMVPFNMFLQDHNRTNSQNNLSRKSPE